jgi:hypothetical protein
MSKRNIKQKKKKIIACHSKKIKGSFYFFKKVQKNVEGVAEMQELIKFPVFQITPLVLSRQAVFWAKSKLMRLIPPPSTKRNNSKNKLSVLLAYFFIFIQL